MTSKEPIRIVIAQLNFLVADIENNAEKIIQTANLARDDKKADMVFFPEMALSGYPAEDLVYRADFQKRIKAALDKIVAEVKDIYVVVGYPEAPDRVGDYLFNSAAVIFNGQIVVNYHKQLLPNYGVFDEKRYFTPGDKAGVVEVKGHKVSITICEDIWHPQPLAMAHAKGADIEININASPFDMYKQLVREKVVIARTREQHIPVVYVNCVGGQDDLIFDGGSFVVSQDGHVVKRLDSFVEKIATLDFDAEGHFIFKEGTVDGYGSTEQRIYDALVLAVRDYVINSGFSEVVIGVSGGVDSALTLAIATDALGVENVHAVFMPSIYTSKISYEDAAQLTQNFTIKLETIKIWPIFKRYQKALKKIFAKAQPDITEENLQARIRGDLLMALANKNNWLVLATSNKSELAVGYATLYGDMAGGFAPLKDVFKTIVYDLAEYRNSLTDYDIIPQRILGRAPSAELKPNQKDIDSLPPYSTLDPILERYIEKDESVEEIMAAGFDEELVKLLVKLVDRNEYKRRQAALGPKISARAFGKDRRYPVVLG